MYLHVYAYVNLYVCAYLIVCVCVCVHIYVCVCEECRLKRGGVVDDAVEHLCVAMAKA